MSKKGRSNRRIFSWLSHFFWSKMMLLCMLCILFVLPGVLSEGAHQYTGVETQEPGGYLGWIQDGGVGVLDALLPEENVVEARKRKRRKKYKHKKHMMPMMILGVLLIKSVLLPLALKGLAVLSGKAVILSMMSLILAAIVGIKSVGQNTPGSKYDVVVVPSSKWRRNDDVQLRADAEPNAPYRFYGDRRRKKRSVFD